MMSRHLPSSVGALAICAVAIGLLLNSSGSAQPGRGLDGSNAEPFVSVGKLIRAGQSRSGTPRYALLDEEGAVSAYVLAPAGMEVATLVNHQVGVTARAMQRGSDALPYILAQHISSLGDQEKPASDEIDLVDFDAEAEDSLLEESTARRAEPTADAALAGPSDEPRILPDFSRSPSKIRSRSTFRDRPHPVESHVGSMPTARGTVSPAAAEVFEEEVAPPMGVLVDPAGSDYGGTVVESEIPRYEYGWDVGDPMMTSGCSSCNPCGVGCTACGPWGRHWIRAEYLLWMAKGMSVPPLVTTSPGSTPVQNAGVLGLSTTEILYGNSDLLDGTQNGLRIQAGMWLDRCQWWGIELDLAGLERGSEDFRRSSEGNPVLARPFYNALIDAQDAELVAYPGIVSGTTAVHVDSRLYWIAPRLRMNLRCADHLPYPALACTGCDPCGGAACAPPGGYRLDMLLGYRYLRLDESLQVREQLTSRRDNVVSQFDLLDSFETENEFNGLELGLSWESYRGPWSLELLGLFMLGNNRRFVSIDGSTTSSTQGVSFTDPGGLLALSSNIGRYTDNEFVVIPEFGATVGYAICPNLRFLLGYSFLFWGNVMRPGEQIDLRVNPDLLPPEQSTSGPLVPAAQLIDTTYWVQGLNVGLDWRW